MRDEAGTAFATALASNDVLLSINVDMNDFNFHNFQSIMASIKANKKKYKRDTIARHKKQIEVLKVCYNKITNILMIS